MKRRRRRGEEEEAEECVQGVELRELFFLISARAVQA